MRLESQAGPKNEAPFQAKGGTSRANGQQLEGSKTWDMSKLAFLKDPSGSPGEDESRRSETGGREMSNEGVAKCRQKT